MNSSLVMKFSMLTTLLLSVHSFAQTGEILSGRACRLPAKLQTAVQKGDNQRALELISELQPKHLNCGSFPGSTGGSPDSRSRYFISDVGGSFLDAVANENYEIVEALLQKGLVKTTTNYYDMAGFSRGRGGYSVVTAIERGNMRLLNLLFKYGAYEMDTPCDLSKVFGKCFSLEQCGLVTQAVLHQHADVVEYLLNKGAEMKPEGSRHHALGIAVASNQIEMVKLLLNKSNDINLKMDRLGTPLEIAISKNLKDMAAFLIQNGAILSTENVAALNKNQEMLNFLLGKGLKIEQLK